MLPKVDELGLKILFLLIPGIAALGIAKSLGPKRPRSDFEAGLQIFLYGILSYATAGLLEGLYIWFHVERTKGFWDTIGESSLGLATLNPSAGLSGGQILFATLVALLMGTAVANLQKHSLPHRILGKWHLTNRIGEVDMWGFTFNSQNIDGWVTVRHHDNGKVYQGWLRGYSSGGDERELLLTDVMVFAPRPESNEMVQVDEVPIVYLGLDRKNTVLEFRATMS